MTPFRLGLLNLSRRRLPSLIALLALALPVATAGLLLRLHALAAARLASLDQSHDAVIGAKAGELDLLFGALNGEGDLPEGFTDNLYQTLRDRAVPVASRQALVTRLIPLTVYARYHGYRVIGSDEAFWQNTGPGAATLTAGRPPHTPPEVTVSESLAQTQHWALGTELNAEAWVSRHEGRNQSLPPVLLRIVGLRRNTGLYWDQVLLGTATQAQATLALLLPTGELNPVWRQHLVHYLLADCPDASCRELSDLINHATVAQLVHVKPALARLMSLSAAAGRLELLITAMILGLGGLAIAGIMVTRFTALAMQLTVLRALGYGRGALALCLATEGFLLATAAVALGAVLDFALFPWLQDVAQVAPVGSAVVLPVWHSLPVWLAALLATSGAACLPLVFLYRRDVHRGLRSP